MNILEILESIEVTRNRNRREMVAKRGIYLASKLDVGPDRVVDKSLSREEWYGQSNENVAIDLLVQNERVLIFSGEKTIGGRITAKFCHENKQVVIEVFLGKNEAAGRRCTVIVILIVHIAGQQWKCFLGSKPERTNKS